MIEGAVCQNPEQTHGPEEPAVKLMSSSFGHNERIPEEFAFGASDPVQHLRLSLNRNPHLRWSGAPSGAKSWQLRYRNAADKWQTATLGLREQRGRAQLHAAAQAAALPGIAAPARLTPSGIAGLPSNALLRGTCPCGSAFMRTMSG